MRYAYAAIVATLALLAIIMFVNGEWINGAMAICAVTGWLSANLQRLRANEWEKVAADWRQLNESLMARPFPHNRGPSKSV